MISVKRATPYGTLKPPTCAKNYSTGSRSNTRWNWPEELASLLSRDSLLRRDEPLARRTTLRVGGKADAYLEPLCREPGYRELLQRLESPSASE